MNHTARTTADATAFREIGDSIARLNVENAGLTISLKHLKYQLRREHSDLVTMCRAFRESEAYCSTTHEGEITDRVLAEEDGPDE